MAATTVLHLVMLDKASGSESEEADDFPQDPWDDFGAVPSASGAFRGLSSAKSMLNSSEWLFIKTSRISAPAPRPHHSPMSFIGPFATSLSGPSSRKLGSWPPVLRSDPFLNANAGAHSAKNRYVDNIGWGVNINL